MEKTRQNENEALNLVKLTRSKIVKLIEIKIQVYYSVIRIQRQVSSMS